MNLHKQLWELRDREFTQTNYTGSLNPESSPQNNLWVFHYVNNHKLQQYITKRWLWIPQSLLTLFAPAHTSSQNHTDFTGFYKHVYNIRIQLQETK